MQKPTDLSPTSTLVTPTAPIRADTHGGRAKCLQRLVRLDLPVPRTVALSFAAVHAIAAAGLPDTAALLAAVRPERAASPCGPRPRIPTGAGPARS